MGLVIEGPTPDGGNSRLSERKPSYLGSGRLAGYLLCARPSLPRLSSVERRALVTNGRTVTNPGSVMLVDVQMGSNVQPRPAFQSRSDVTRLAIPADPSDP
jgi:hypothetical protein